MRGEGAGAGRRAAVGFKGEGERPYRMGHSGEGKGVKFEACKPLLCRRYTQLLLLIRRWDSETQQALHSYHW